LTSYKFIATTKVIGLPVAAVLWSVVVSISPLAKSLLTELAMFTVALAASSTQIGAVATARLVLGLLSPALWLLGISLLIVLLGGSQSFLMIPAYFLSSMVGIHVLLSWISLRDLLCSAASGSVRAGLVVIRSLLISAGAYFPRIAWYADVAAFPAGGAVRLKWHKIMVVTLATFLWLVRDAPSRYECFQNRARHLGGGV
jgi:hypothetical protein